MEVEHEALQLPPPSPEEAVQEGEGEEAVHPVGGGEGPGGAGGEAALRGRTKEEICSVFGEPTEDIF